MTVSVPGDRMTNEVEYVLAFLIMGNIIQESFTPVNTFLKLFY